jgi:hypothetical protein
MSDDDTLSNEEMKRLMESKDLLEGDSDDSEEEKSDKETDQRVLDKIMKDDSESDSGEDFNEEDYKKVIESGELSDSDLSQLKENEEIKSPIKLQGEIQISHSLAIVDRHERKNKLEDKPELTLHLEDSKKYVKLQVNRMKYTNVLKIHEAFFNTDNKKVNASPTSLTVL